MEIANAATLTAMDHPVRPARAAAVVTWCYAAGFGLPTVPVAVYLLQRGRLPSFLGLFDMYAGPWSNRLDDGPFAVVLISFLPVTAAAAWAARHVWRGSRRGAIVSLALLPVEAVFWIGFALPIPWVLGAARVALLTAAWRRLR
jgi:hypothetical protein